MTIRIGQTTVSGSGVQLTPPGGMGTFRALRLTNFTTMILRLTGIKSNDASEQWLVPLQQMVYHVDNINVIPTLTGLTLGTLDTVPTVLAEWSDDPLIDFIGQYPCQVSVGASPPSIGLGCSYGGGSSRLNEWIIIPADPLRAWLQLQNTSLITTPGVDAHVYWSGADIVTSYPSAPPAGCPYLPIGASTTIDTCGAIAVFVSVTGTPGGGDGIFGSWTYGTFGIPSYPIPTPS